MTCVTLPVAFHGVFSADAERLGAKTNLTCIVMKRLGGNMAMKLGPGQNGFTEHLRFQGRLIVRTIVIYITMRERGR